MNNNILKNNKGVSLIITFFILTIILAIVLSVSVLLYGQIKIIRNIGNSVVAFYSADSGVEKILYYDRKQIPVGGVRGICNICNACLQNCTPGVDCDESDCQSCISTELSPSGCDPLSCSDCHINFSTETSFGESYDIDIVVTQQCKVSSEVVNVYGFYKDISRAIRLDSATKVSTLKIPSSGATATAQGQTGVNMIISADVLDPNNVGIESVIAAITGLGDENGGNCVPACSNNPCCAYREVALTGGGGGGNYSHPWNFGLQGVNYNISIMATDNFGYCVEVKNITITYQ
ncbi:MAG: hypothetical protein A2904_01640 [Candidatus Staskawiczbacteria bacterium RIFCSPLOWO2_01_FULL_33_9]|uniref:Uncharacterized protein n=1 Tax=Candidatus Staskawiczbacteria bacterium RIFCSPLOWO2_01_FULL_33_9 TaxID=1802211 RepID=A0A1G2I6M7_9BACT|nr:MAG: hypothetical protein A2904_01640 [Candidatus Staskawiczbacteria bacterium RIFCSPLOWO2_01_FULL_33_9]